MNNIHLFSRIKRKNTVKKYNFRIFSSVDEFGFSPWLHNNSKLKSTLDEGLYTATRALLKTKLYSVCFDLLYER